MLDILEVERNIINDVKPHIVFSSLIMRECGIIDDVIWMISDVMFSVNEDVRIFYAHKYDLFHKIIVRTVLRTSFYEHVIRLQRYELTNEEILFILYEFIEFKTSTIEISNLRDRKLPSDYAPSKDFRINLTEEGYRVLLIDIIKYNNDMFPFFRSDCITRGINPKYIPKTSKII